MNVIPRLRSNRQGIFELIPLPVTLTFFFICHTPAEPEYDSTRIGILKPGKIPQEDKYGLSPT